MTILDLINIEFESLSVDDFVIKHRGENLEGKQFTDYEKKIYPKVFGIFDMLQLKMFSDKFNISSGSPINIQLYKSSGNPTQNEIKEIINTLYKSFGNDSDGKGEFNSLDIVNIKNGNIDRFWCLTKYGKSLPEPTENTYCITLGINPPNLSSLNNFFNICILRLDNLF